jgi:SAM-dependent methyltransferase
MPRMRQEGYSSIQPSMLDEAGRAIKARKIVSVTEHFLGLSDLDGLVALDIGCSGGAIARTLASEGARVVGVDIDIDALVSAGAQGGGLFVAADGEALPLASGSVDVAIFNQSYEHVVRPSRVVDELVRVLAPEGIVYLGLHNRYTLFEPHYRLPFLSWLPSGMADRYLRLSGKGDRYHERLLGWRRLKDLFARFTLWDYSYTVAAEPARFAATDVVAGRASAMVRRAPAPLRRAAAPLVPGYVWIGTPAGDAGPRGERVAVPPRRIG